MIRIEGYTLEELLDLPVDELDGLVFSGRPVVRVCSAHVLVEGQRRGTRLMVDLAHIDGGGEAALPTRTSFIERFAASRQFEHIDWLVRATNCARPNEKFRRVLIRKGFEVRTLPEFGECYFKSTAVGPSHAV
jgi:hypothetical protein